MFQNTKCECGHQNPTGTVLCESCGKPLIEDLPLDSPLEMRYDGVARRSQKANPDLIDRVWNFFSSVKIAVWLIVITLIGAAIGTIYPQESSFINMDDAAQYYKDTYGVWGLIYQALGFSRTYESWWFVGLLVMIGTSLVICSLDRVLPLYKALSKQQIRKHLTFLTRQQTVYTSPIELDPEEWTEKLAKQLKKKRYRVHRDGDALLAEKNRFSRWGPYINHIGLIVFLLAVLARGVPAWHMDQYVTLDEGQTKQIPNTNYYVKNEKFTVDFYKDEELPDSLKGTNRAKLFETKAVLYTCTAYCDDPVKDPVLAEVDRHDIQVNSPLSYQGLKLYQYNYEPKVHLISVKPMLIDSQTGESYGPFELPMANPPLTYSVGPYTLKLSDVFPDFGMDEQNRPMTKSRDPNNPAFVFIVTGPGLPETGEFYIYFPLPTAEDKLLEQQINASFQKSGNNSGRFSFEVGKMENVEFSQYTTYLNVRVDRAMPFVWVGAGISMIGLIMGFYWQHRRIWTRIDDGVLTLGAHTNKNTYGVRSEVASALKNTGIVVDQKALDNRRNTR
ncbi:cytochrome c biogenesis protein ResB [Cohnella lubricantis]|uniref:Cytochrome c biogenesis protein ResB n=1 Tax=Cohnella lubricantis TaxID=2163172 RepID=A0A841TEH6_9BACL|nr:cytochrome c biogenesis protein ResB [Cohnella lubricantis]MBB6677708.1 cytochrome c biogenesis protein ResB [Cohnella lubricantis]MBP2117670.1 cytochrome c biogenesis protein [Cohnella lubricantis]